MAVPYSAGCLYQAGVSEGGRYEAAYRGSVGVWGDTGGLDRSVSPHHPQPDSLPEEPQMGDVASPHPEHE